MSGRRATLATRLVCVVVVAYIVAVVMITALQRKLLFPAPRPVPVPEGVATRYDGRSPGGRRVVALGAVRDAREPVIAYFHGNGMQLADCASLVSTFRDLGCGAWCVEYPGYGPLADDAVSEAAIYDVADGAMAMLRTELGVSPARTVLLGQLLGTGVATWLAARGAGGRLALMSPYRSIPSVAAQHFPWLPVRWLVRDRFDSEACAPQVSIPVLVLHGTRDEVIPFAQGESLARSFPHATLRAIEGAHHNDLWERPELYGALRAFVAAMPR